MSDEVQKIPAKAIEQSTAFSSLPEAIYGESQYIIYQGEDGATRIEVKLQEETVWLTRTQICELYHASKSNVSDYYR